MNEASTIELYDHLKNVNIDKATNIFGTSCKKKVRTPGSITITLATEQKKKQAMLQSRRMRVRAYTYHERSGFTDKKRSLGNLRNLQTREIQEATLLSGNVLATGQQNETIYDSMLILPRQRRKSDL